MKELNQEASCGAAYPMGVGSPAHPLAMTAKDPNLLPSGPLKRYILRLRFQPEVVSRPEVPGRRERNLNSAPKGRNLEEGV